MKAKVAKALSTARDQTVAHIRRHLKKDDDQGDISGLDLAALASMGLIDTDLAGVADDSGQLFLAQLSISNPDLFGQVSERAVAYARDRAAELVTGVDEATRDELRDLITDGLEENIGLDGIIDSIKTAYAFSDERAELIARTEVAMANGNGVLTGMKAARDVGVKLKKVWLPDADACDDCQDNGDAGPIDLDDQFPTGDDAPPAHPRCRCDMASEIYDEDEEGDE